MRSKYYLLIVTDKWGDLAIGQYSTYREALAKASEYLRFTPYLGERIVPRITIKEIIE